MLIHLQNIVVQKDRKTIISVPELSLGPTGMIAVVGPNGAGKSTFLKVLGGVEKSLGGSAAFEQGDLLKLSGRDRARLTGFVPQYFTPHWNQKVSELLELSEEKSGALHDLFQTSVEEFNLTKLISRHWEHLSGGERARVLLAMALGGKPPLIIADEPGAAMDVKHNLQMLSSFQKRSSEALILVAIHDLNFALRFFSRILVLNEGAIVFDGKPATLVQEQVLDQVFGIKFMTVNITGGFLLFPEQISKTSD
ncbi:MAG: ABC transporter ATP-binding protein [Deltaproteobacteria bacterium]|jgi:iron complex transport system ATP-binding protein|nr:ABC transporter ATP-binding protein [Deltaproteobacteria bacterium]